MLQRFRPLLCLGLAAFSLAGCSGESDDSSSTVLDGASAMDASSEVPETSTPEAEVDTGEPDATPEAAAPIELCNFLDDDGDGLVDEGFAWKPGPFQHLLTTERFAVSPVILDLNNGAFAMAGFDGFGEPGDRAFLGIWNVDGETLAGPVYHEMALGSHDQVALSQLGPEKMLMLFGSTDWDGCKLGCPITALEASTQNASLTEVSTWSLAGLRGDEALRLACPSAQQCIVYADSASPTGPTLLSLGTPAWQLPLQGSASFALDANRLYVLESIAPVDGGTGRAQFSILGLDGQEVLAPRDVGPLPLVPGLKRLAGNTLAVLALEDNFDAPGQLIRLDDNGVVQGTPFLIPAGRKPMDLAALQDTLILSLAVGFNEVEILRLGPDLQPIAAPLNPTSIPGAYQGERLFISGQALLYLQANYDGRSVQMVRMECAQ